DFDAGADFFYVAFANISGVDAKVHSGTLSKKSFNADLTHAIGHNELAADHAVLFQAKHGDLKGELFLIVDTNGSPGYQAQADLVIRLPHATHMDDFGPGNFHSFG